MTVKEVKEKYNTKIFVATGGTLARKIIVDNKPKAVIAVACERDLTSGVREVNKIPVLGIFNSRPNGPCIDTNIKINEEKEALTIESPFSDFKKTKKGKFAYKLIFMIYKNLVIPKIARSNKQLNKIKDNNLRDSLIKNRFFLLSMFDHNCPRSIFMASNGATNYHQILGMVDLANGKYLRAIKNFLTKDK